MGKSWLPFLSWAAIVLASVLGAGAYVLTAYRQHQLGAYADLGHAYLQTLLVNHALTDHIQGTDGGAVHHLSAGFSARQPGLILRIWSEDGVLLCSTMPDTSLRPAAPAELGRVRAEGAVYRVGAAAAFGEAAPPAVPAFTLLAPILDTSSVLIGEVHLPAAGLMDGQARIRLVVASAAATVLMGMAALLVLHRRLEARLQAATALGQRLSASADALRRERETARRDAASADERALNMVGAELHDGPVQTLGLLSLLRGRGAGARLPDGTTQQELVERVAAELRRLAAGLVLPEIEGLGPSEVIRLAAERHRGLTGQPVALDLPVAAPRLDQPRNTCLYRVVQEALTNAARHGGPAAPRVTLRTAGTVLVIEVRSAPAPASEGPGVGNSPTQRLGVLGMNRRLEAFGGTLELTRTAEETTLRATLPAGSASEE